MKISSSSKKEPKTKVNKLEEKLQRLQLENRRLRAENRKERKRTQAAKRSRDKWKEKNKVKSNKINGLERKLSESTKAKGHHYDLNIVWLCILLRIVGGCSYRSIPRILEVLQMCFDLKWERIPCANTIENWVSKLGLYSMEGAVEKISKKSKQMSLIIDENMRLGNERMLLLLLAPYEKQSQGGLSYEDVEVVYMGGKKSWTGAKICKEIANLVATKEMNIGNILSDEDSKLLKSAKLANIAHLPDIGHAVGNCLRKVFKKDENYQAFLKLIGQFQSKSVNRKLTYLRPPKQRVKARFMNQAPLVKWGQTILERFEELEEEEQLFFKDLRAHQGMLNTLSRCIELSKCISIPLKVKGLNQVTLKKFTRKIVQAKKQLSTQAKSAMCKELDRELVQQFIGHLETYAHKYKDFLGDKKGSYHVSSDIIESIFGKHKNMVSTNPLVGMTILDLELPVHCQDKTKIGNFIQPALEGISMTNLLDWRNKHSHDNQALKRKIWFKKRA